MTARQSATVFGVLAAALLSLPLGASAQPAPGVASKWRVEPAAGIWYRDLSGAAAGHQVGPVVSLHVSKQRGAADRLTASVGYHRLEDALELTTCSSATQCRTDSYDSETFYVTAGLAVIFGEATPPASAWASRPAWPGIVNLTTAVSAPPAFCSMNRSAMTGHLSFSSCRRSRPAVH